MEYILEVVVLCGNVFGVEVFRVVEFCVDVDIDIEI